jgi:hypothetical protein
MTLDRRAIRYRRGLRSYPYLELAATACRRLRLPYRPILDLPKLKCRPALKMSVDRGGPEVAGKKINTTRLTQVRHSTGIAPTVVPQSSAEQTNQTTTVRIGVFYVRLSMGGRDGTLLFPSPRRRSTDPRCRGAGPARCLHWNAACRRPLNSLRDRVGVSEVVLVALPERFGISGRHLLYVMAERT